MLADFDFFPRAAASSMLALQLLALAVAATVVLNLSKLARFFLCSWWQTHHDFLIQTLQNLFPEVRLKFWLVIGVAVF